VSDIVTTVVCRSLLDAMDDPTFTPGTGRHNTSGVSV